MARLDSGFRTRRAGPTHVSPCLDYVPTSHMSFSPTYFSSTTVQVCSIFVKFRCNIQPPPAVICFSQPHPRSNAPRPRTQGFGNVPMFTSAYPTLADWVNRQPALQLFERSVFSDRCAANIAFVFRYHTFREGTASPPTATSQASSKKWHA